MAERAILLFAFAIILSEGFAFANDPILDGSSVEAKDVVAECDAIFVGKITDAGVRDMSLDHLSLGPEIHGIKVKVLQVLRGKIAAIGGSLSLSIYLITSKHETTPRVGDTYIFFVRQQDDTILKLLPSTADNIAMVDKLISN
jgi:hypothetical protein